MSVEDRGFDKTKPFWLVLPIDRLDGSFTPPQADGRASFQGMDRAMACAVAYAAGYGGQYAIYRCEPVSVISERD